ncbi:MAG: ABC transporter substrate-binding protein [Armatimonadetes bacterium]|nr:ABC transporter substrate-binding protein [Armatimonadota bacterium]
MTTRLCGLLLVGVLLALAAPAQSGPAGRNTLVIGAAKDMVSPDPYRTNDADSQFVYHLIFDPLVIIGPDSKPRPMLAEKWEVSPDGATYTFHLRKNVKFHNGDEVTADDVVFSFRRAFDPANASGRKAENIRMVKSYTAVGRDRVQVTLEFPFAPFPAALGALFVQPRKAVEAAGAQFEKRPVGSGPYRLVEWVVNNRVVLEANTDYWLKAPRIERVILRPIPDSSTAAAAVLAGDVDVTATVTAANLPVLKRDPGVEVLKAPANNYVFLGFRMLRPPYTDARFRKAVYMSLHWDAAIKTMVPQDLGLRAYGSVPPSLWPRDDEALREIALKENDREARELFQALIRDNVMPRDFKIVVAPPPDDTRVKLAEVLVANLRENGVGAEVLRLEWATYINYLESNNMIIYMLGTIPAYPDPDANLRWLFGSAGQQARFLNIRSLEPNLDEQLQKAQRSPSHREREILYRDIQRDMMRKVYHIPMYYLNNVVAVRKGVVKGLKPSQYWRWELATPWSQVEVTR